MRIPTSTALCVIALSGIIAAATIPRVEAQGILPRQELPSILHRRAENIDLSNASTLSERSTISQRLERRKRALKVRDGSINTLNSAANNSDARTPTPTRKTKREEEPNADSSSASPSKTSTAVMGPRRGEQTPDSVPNLINSTTTVMRASVTTPRVSATPTSTDETAAVDSDNPTTSASSNAQTTMTSDFASQTESEIPPTAKDSEASYVNTITAAPTESRTTASDDTDEDTNTYETSPKVGIQVHLDMETKENLATDWTVSQDFSTIAGPVVATASATPTPTPTETDTASAELSLSKAKASTTMTTATATETPTPTRSSEGSTDGVSATTTGDLPAAPSSTEQHRPCYRPHHDDEDSQKSGDQDQSQDHGHAGDKNYDKVQGPSSQDGQNTSNGTPTESAPGPAASASLTSDAADPSSASPPKIESADNIPMSLAVETPSTAPSR